MSSNARSTSTSSLRSAVASLSARAKAHHQDVQNAYELYYGAGGRTPRPSIESSRTSSASSSSNAAPPVYVSQAKPAAHVAAPAPAARPSTARAAWDKVKQHARDHHDSVNAAYGLYYGRRV